MTKVQLHAWVDPVVKTRMTDWARAQDRPLSWAVEHAMRQLLAGTDADSLFDNALGRSAAYAGLAEADLAVQPIRVDGQTVTEADRGVRITHLPTGLEAVATEGRSRIENMADAISQLAQLVGDVSRETSTTPREPQPESRIDQLVREEREDAEHRLGLPPELKHRHRFTERIAGTEQHTAGKRTAMFRCSCGEQKRDRF